MNVNWGWLTLATTHGAARLDRQLLARRHREDEGADPPASAGLWSAGPWSVALASTAAICAVAVCLVPHFAFGPALHPSFYQRDAQAKAAAAADAVVPSGVTVEATDNLGPQLSARDTVLLWDGDGSTPPLGAPWVVANVRHSQFTFLGGVREQRQRVAFLESNGYQVIFQRDGYVVLHRVGAGARGPGMGSPG